MPAGQVSALQVLVLGVEAAVAVRRDRIQLRANVSQRNRQQTRSALSLVLHRMFVTSKYSECGTASATVGSDILLQDCARSNLYEF